MSIDEKTEYQMERISSGVVEIIPEEEMRAKVRRSIEEARPLTVKLGVDPTRPDLHIGHAVPLTKLRHFQELGHQVVLIIGDFTSLIGDPSDQDTTRPVLTPDEIERNAMTYVEQARKLVDTSKSRLVRNSEWLAPLTLKEVLDLTAKFTVARIMERDDFSRRLKEGKPLGLHEFLYPVMQAYDSVVLGADVEIGGTDQKFNLLAGRNLQRALGQEPQCVLTLPLLEGTDGVKKMSKSLGNDIGLTDAPGEMFGKVMSIPDDVLWRYFTLVTNVGLSELESMKGEVEEGRMNPRDAKSRLAWEIVSIYHGADAADAARAEFSRVFSERQLPEEVPTVDLPASFLKGGTIWVVDLLVRLGLAGTRGEARRLITGGGISIGGDKITDVDRELTAEEIRGVVIRRGRKSFVRVELTGEKR